MIYKGLLLSTATTRNGEGPSSADTPRFIIKLSRSRCVNDSSDTDTKFASGPAVGRGPHEIKQGAKGKVQSSRECKWCLGKNAEDAELHSGAQSITGSFLVAVVLLMFLSSFKFLLLFSL